MVKKDVARAIVHASGYNMKTCLAAVDSILGTMRNALLEGRRIELRGFGVFTVQKRKIGFGRNILAGEKVVLPKGKTVRFRPGKFLKSLPL